MAINPYIHFNGNAEEALNHYRDALGGDLQIMRFAGSPAESCAPDGWGDKVLHGALQTSVGLLLASDASTDQVRNPGDNIEVAVQVDSESDAERIFSKLGQDGNITMPLSETFFSPKFGMLVDKFGIKWLIVTAVAAAAAA
ncbi:MAG TPA: VOC family protein [Candidatus Eremiobacteraceae bacterium]|nr:VOC family protein [Candidatus Eremiobacteraceae bacterium]